MNLIINRGHRKFLPVLDFIYPTHCPVCGQLPRSAAADARICDDCRQRLPVITDSCCMKCGKALSDESREYCDDCSRRRRYFIRSRALYTYQGEIRTALYQLKYSNRREYAVFFGEEMARVYGRWICDIGIDLIVPIPLHPKKKRMRGYNQAELLARRLSEKTGISMDSDLLYRRFYTDPLKTMGPDQRRRQMAHVFAAAYPAAPEMAVLLVDDIYTTGTTMNEASLALLQAGCRRIYGITVAVGSG